MVTSKHNASLKIKFLERQFGCFLCSNNSFAIEAGFYNNPFNHTVFIFTLYYLTLTSLLTGSILCDIICLLFLSYELFHSHICCVVRVLCYVKVFVLRQHGC